ncbi:putative molybdenum cofactor guanylyltransferase [Spirochaetia bacterium]|nr:putative molybdenum cofactor guanylyltransferase [Spirochaetia bacterium]
MMDSPTLPFGSALVLAGGKGSRIGRDKKELEINGVRIIDTLIGMLGAVFDEIIVSSNTPFKRGNVITVRDTIGGGPLSGIYAGLTVCKSDFLYVIACDMPFISLEYINFLKNKITRSLENTPGITTCVMRRADSFLEPFNSFWRKSASAQIYTALQNNQYKILPLLKQLAPLEITYNEAVPYLASAGVDLFYNINYREDLEKLTTN